MICAGASGYTPQSQACHSCAKGILLRQAAYAPSLINILICSTSDVACLFVTHAHLVDRDLLCRTCWQMGWRGLLLWAATSAASRTMQPRSCAPDGLLQGHGSPLLATTMQTAFRSSTCAAESSFADGRVPAFAVIGCQSDRAKLDRAKYADACPCILAHANL